MDYKYKTFEPMPHQKMGFESLIKHQNLAIFFDQGTGKTKTVLDYLDWRVENKGIEKILVVAPKAVMASWNKECELHSRFYTPCILGGGSKRTRKILEDNLDEGGLFLVNYEAVRAIKSSGFNLASLPWDCVIADESTKIKHGSSKQSRAMHDFPKLCPSAKRVIMTGMAITNSPLDIFSQYLFLEPKIYGKSWVRFQSHYAEVRKRHVSTHSFKEVVGFRNLKDLTEKMHGIAIRVTKKECLKDLPPKVFQQRIIPWNKQHRQKYLEMATHMITECSGMVIPAKNVLSKLTKLREMCNGWVYDEWGNAVEVPHGSAKIKELRSLLSEVDGKLAIWCEFTQDIRNIREALASDGVPTSCIVGGMCTQDVEMEIHRFQEEESRCIILQSQVGARGLTLTAASTAIYFSNPYSLDLRVQSEDRFHRIGQLAESVLYIDLCMEGSVDEAIVEAQRRGMNLANAINNFKLDALIGGRLESNVGEADIPAEGGSET